MRFEKVALHPENYREVLAPLIAGGFLVNLSVDVSSTALVALCREVGALYIDTCIEPWAGGYLDRSKPLAARTNYALREEVRALRGEGPTAIIAHGANPGMVSHLFKRALVRLAADMGHTVAPQSREAWAQLAMDLGVKGIHIAERDTQWADIPKRPDEFVNTWSVEGFISEGLQPAELGWGSHERHVPHEATFHEHGCRAAIFLTRPGATTRVRSWTPNSGPIQGYLITHNESISIADYLSIEKNGETIYRPTVHYAYHPCDDTILSLHEFQGRNLRRQGKWRLMNDEIVDGMDELGVLLYGHVAQRVLVRQPAHDPPGARARALPERDRPAGDLGGGRGHDLGDRESAPRRARRRRARPRSHPRRSRSPTSASWSASTPTGRRSTTATASSFPRTSIATIRGSSST